MFVNFSITPQGLTESQPRKRPNRMNLGCIPCRRKKKGCDAQRPVCGRCRNSYGQDECIWPVESPSKGQKRDRGTAEDAVPDIVAPSPTLRSETSEWALATTGTFDVPSPEFMPMDLGFEDMCPWIIPDAVTNISPDLSPKRLLDISLAFQNKVLCLDGELPDPIILQSLPEVLNFPPLLHAWVACSVIALSKSLPYWQEKAIQHYDCAVSGLHAALRSPGNSSMKWQRETVLLLHIYEGFQSKRDEGVLGKAHLTGAHELFQSSVNRSTPLNYHDALLLEAYIMHTANNCLFQPDVHLPIHHIHSALQTYCSTMRHFNIANSWRQSPWLGFLGPNLVNIIYKVSWLTHIQTLNQDHLTELDKIVEELSQWTAPAYCEEQNLNHLDLPPKRLVLLSQMYWCASSCLAFDLLSRTRDATIFDAADIVQQGLSLLSELTDFVQTIGNHLWPLLVIGSAVEDVDEQKNVEAWLERVDQAIGPESVKRARRFLAKAWTRDFNDCMVGRNIFKDRDVLRQMFI